MSSGRTGSTPWTMIGPASTSARTKCTVQPWKRTPAASARRWLSRPRKAGSSEGWMLSSRSRQRSTKSALRIAHEPGEANDLDRVTSQRRVERVARTRRDRRGAVVDDLAGDAGGRAHARARRPPARSRSPARSRRWRRGRGAARRSAPARLLPRPEIRTATRRRARPAAQPSMPSTCTRGGPSPATSSPSR